MARLTELRKLVNLEPRLEEITQNSSEKKEVWKRLRVTEEREKRQLI